MTSLSIALKYLDIFFSGKEMDRLYEIMAGNMKFEGPFCTFDTAHDYIENLKSDPPVECQYKMLKSFEDGAFVNLIYQFMKPNVAAPMSQLFEVRDGKIAKISLIFDSKQFTARGNS